jgi:hypothetical protein
MAILPFTNPVAENVTGCPGAAPGGVNANHGVACGINCRFPVRLMAPCPVAVATSTRYVPVDKFAGTVRAALKLPPLTAADPSTVRCPVPAIRSIPTSELPEGTPLPVTVTVPPGESTAGAKLKVALLVAFIATGMNRSGATIHNLGIRLTMQVLSFRQTANSRLFRPV